MNVTHLDTPKYGTHLFAYRGREGQRTLRVVLGQSEVDVLIWSPNGWVTMAKYPSPGKVPTDMTSQYVMKPAEREEANQRGVIVANALAQRAVATIFEHNRFEDTA